MLGAVEAVTADIPLQTSDTLRAPLREVRCDAVDAADPSRPRRRAVHLRRGPGRRSLASRDRPERVPYSIASAPAETAASGLLDFLIKVEPSGRWGHQFDRLEPGMTIGVRGPFGAFLFPAQPRESRFLFIAGGTGIAPIRAMIRQALAGGQTGAHELLYSAQTTDDFAYLPELGEMAIEHGLDLRLCHARQRDGGRWR